MWPKIVNRWRTTALGEGIQSFRVTEPGSCRLVSEGALFGTNLAREKVIVQGFETVSTRAMGQPNKTQPENCCSTIQCTRYISQNASPVLSLLHPHWSAVIPMEHSCLKHHHIPLQETNRGRKKKPIKTKHLENSLWLTEHCDLQNFQRIICLEVRIYLHTMRGPTVILIS